LAVPAGVAGVEFNAQYPLRLQRRRDALGHQSPSVIAQRSHAVVAGGSSHFTLCPALRDQLAQAMIDFEHLKHTCTAAKPTVTCGTA
jgi:hypothetical protein